MSPLRSMALIALGSLMCAGVAQAQSCDWPLWQNYAKRFVQDDGWPAAQPPADTVLLVTGELERKPQGTAWVKAFEEHGVLVITQPDANHCLGDFDF